ncbi:hypothetical protein ACLB1E_28330 [Escherichia coli]
MQLLQNGHDVIILDNLCNSKRSVLPVIERLGGKHPTFVEGDIRNEALMTEYSARSRYRHRDPLRRAESRWRIGTKTAGILRQQCQRYSAPD